MLVFNLGLRIQIQINLYSFEFLDPDPFPNKDPDLDPGVKITLKFKQTINKNTSKNVLFFNFSCLYFHEKNNKLFKVQNC